MKKLLIALVVLVVLAVVAVLVADSYLRGLAEEHAEREIGKALPQFEGVEVTLDGFPFVLGVLASGEVEALHVTIERVREAGLEAHDLSLDVEAISLDKDALIDEQRLVVTNIGNATAIGFITDDEVSKMVKREVTFSPGAVKAEVKGHVVKAKATVVGRTVQLAAPIPGIPPLVFPLPSQDVLPCSPELELLEGELRLSCSLSELPEALRRAMAQG